MSSGVNGGVVVLKFGSSVLDGPEGFRGAAREVAREVSNGRRVVAVVSAAPGVTDHLLASAAAVGAVPGSHGVARLLATAEATSVALLELALEAEGVDAPGDGLPTIALATEGPALDADPVGVDVEAIRRALERRPVLVVPGFVGRDRQGSPTVLGRGGSDLTALFLARALDADECRLVKDVDGVYPADPNAPGGPQWPFSFASWERVLEVAGQLVQPKAVRYARTHALRFRVAALGGRGTWVGAAAEVLV